MAETIHPAAPDHLPMFITAPGETDVLLTGSAVFLVALVLLAGSLYFWLHALPERMAHGASKIQFELVAVLALLALFTHNTVFWVAALLIALVPVPDFWSPLASMADSLRRMAGQRPRFATSDQASLTTPEEIIVAPQELAATALPPVTESHAGRPREAVAEAHPVPSMAAADHEAPPAPQKDVSAVAGKSGDEGRRGVSVGGAEP